MQILNEMYSNPDVANLLIYGIEGKYYEFVDEEKWCYWLSGRSDLR